MSLTKTLALPTIFPKWNDQTAIEEMMCQYDFDTGEELFNDCDPILFMSFLIKTNNMDGFKTLLTSFNWDTCDINDIKAFVLPDLDRSVDPHCDDIINLVVQKFEIKS